MWVTGQARPGLCSHCGGEGGPYSSPPHSTGLSSRPITPTSHLSLLMWVPQKDNETGEGRLVGHLDLLKSCLCVSECHMSPGEGQIVPRT